MKFNKRIIFSIAIFLFGLLLLVSSTYAWFKWRSTTGINFIMTLDNSSQAVVTFYGGNTITGTIAPSESPIYGKVKVMNISTNILANDTFNLYLKINTLPNDLKVNYFKWQLVSCDLSESSSCASTATVNESGNFSAASMSEYYDSTTGDLLLLENEVIPLSLDLYLYLWIDGNVDNDVVIGNKDIDFDIYAKGTSVGSYNEGS